MQLGKLKRAGLLAVFTSLVIGIISISADKKVDIEISGSDTAHDILARLGEKELDNLPSMALKNVSAEAGKRMVLEGFSKDGSGRQYAKLSNHFVCTSCHNIEKENTDLTSIDPQARLEYAVENKLPFLQGSSLYGLVNRATFYNGDYVKKYGDMARKAHQNIREAIQLCATECAQGRRLKPWELESVLAYMWELQIKIEDLNLNEEEKILIEDAINKEENQTAAVALIQSKYRKDSPATFVKPPDNLRKGFDQYTGNIENGKNIYELGCQHCHENRRYSFFELDNSKLTFSYLEKHLKRHNRFSFYWVSRYGTKPKPGKKAYMPQFTKERMSDQQLEDLRAYIESRAN